MSNDGRRLRPGANNNNNKSRLMANGGRRQSSKSGGGKRFGNLSSNGRRPISAIFVIIVLIAFLCGLALGVSIVLTGDEPADSNEVQYVNVTKNITKYENGTDMIETEDGTYVSSGSFDDNVTEGENVTAFNVTSGNLY